MMGRILVIENSAHVPAAERLSMLYNGFVVGGGCVPIAQQIGIENIRRAGRILDKFEEVATITQIAPGAREVKLEPRDAVTKLYLSEPEFAMLLRNFDATPWETKFAREVVHLRDWLDTIKPQDIPNG